MEPQRRQLASSSKLDRSPSNGSLTITLTLTPTLTLTLTQTQTQTQTQTLTLPLAPESSPLEQLEARQLAVHRNPQPQPAQRQDLAHVQVGVVQEGRAPAQRSSRLLHCSLHAR